MEYINKLGTSQSFEEARSIIEKSMILEFLDELYDTELSHMILHTLLEERGREVERQTVRQYIAELESEGSVIARNIGCDKFPLIMAKLRAPLAELPDCTPVH